ncbi:MAG: DNA double-strand break repair nuclease NurA, partial [Anaerolineales bacterium]|nr:DNA double-strand break repair nuclease NurA [Anaerolineales bacterium]
MTLEFEKLHDRLNEMARVTAQRQQDRGSYVDELLALLRAHARSWPRIALALDTADARADQKYYRAARPFSDQEPLDQGIDPPPAPEVATIIATDGSQIMPDRHAAYLYYLVNIGGIVYFHGDGRPPHPFTQPELRFPRDEADDADFLLSSGAVSIERDKQEIQTLANTAWNLRDAAAPRLGILDQRLLYWPIGGSEGQINEDVAVWLRGMTKVRDSGALLAGYIDRPL